MIKFILDIEHKNNFREGDNMEIKEYQMIDVDKIMVNPENPRHNPVLILDETFIMQQLVTNAREANSMYKLISDIYKDGWYAQSIITVVYDENSDKYVAWDGNRRTTALKILKYPELLDAFNHFSYTQIRGIKNLSKNIKDKSFFQIPCYVSPSFEECKGYIRNIHTNDTGALRWDAASIKRFEQKLGIKNIFTQLQGYCPKAFANLRREFPVSKFEKIVSSKIGRQYLEIDFTNNILTCLSPIEDLERKVSKIINDINSDKITTETIKNIKNIKEYLYPESEGKDEIADIIVSNNVIYNKDKDEHFQQTDMFSGYDSGYLNVNKSEDNNNVNRIKKIAYSKINMNEISNLNNTPKLIRKNQDILFKNIDISKLNMKNERSIGIRDLCYEIRSLSYCNNYKRYPISYCFLIRSLLEQSTIYFLMNKGKWEGLKKGNNNKDLKLEGIIRYISKNKENIIEDSTIIKCWGDCFDKSGTKNYLDLVIHHPYRVIANVEAIKLITDIGMFAIIQYLISK